MKGSPVQRVFFAFLIALGSIVTAGAQQPSANTKGNQPAELKRITDPAEFADYSAAINTTTLESRQAALDAFLQRFPNSVMRDEVEDNLFEIIVRLDNERNARVRAELRYKRIRDTVFARNLAPRHDLNHYAPCRLGQFEMHEALEDDKPFYRTVSTSKGERNIQVTRRTSFYIAYGGIPFINLKAERLGDNYAQDKQLLLDSLKMLSAEPDTDTAAPLPVETESFEVYGINRRQLSGTVLGAYLLFNDADRTVITLYLMNTSPSTPRFHTMKEYGKLRDDFLMAYFVCHGTP
jgi:hypothetical protein